MAHAILQRNQRRFRLLPSLLLHWLAHRSTFEELPDVSLLGAIEPSWETDGLRLLENCWSPARIQLTFSRKPNVSRLFVATRAKGRLRDALRKAGHPQHFSRKLSVPSVGENATKQVAGKCEAV